MSEESNLDTSSVAQPASQPASVSAGQILKDARLASGLHIGTLSMALKVPVKKLEALESNDWTVLPDRVFVRALATSVCRQIKIDSAPVLAALPQATQNTTLQINEKMPLNQPFRAPGDAKFAWFTLPVSIPMVAGALALMLGSAVLIFLPNKAKEGTNTRASEVALPMMPLTESASAPTIAAAASSATVNSGNSVLRIASKGVVWIEVKDSKGAVLVQRTMQPKEVANVSGQPPLAVVIGRINEIESVTVRGNRMNLEGMSPDNIARFEVK